MASNLFEKNTKGGKGVLFRSAQGGEKGKKGVSPGCSGDGFFSFVSWRDIT